MKYISGLIVFITLSVTAVAQCSVCTKTAMQLGEKPALGMNSGILYLMGMPFIIVGFIAYRWWKRNSKFEKESVAGTKAEMTRLQQ